MQKKEFSVDLAGTTFTAEFSDLAERANGSVVVKMGDTVVLATAVMSPKEKEGMNWFPLTVDYEEKFYAAGQILGSRFLRREGRPSDEAVLTGRVIDRTIRPLFDQTLRNEIQVVATVLSIDEYDPDILSVNAASIALATSNIPWDGPVSAVRVIKRKGAEDFEINPSYAVREEELELEIVACGKDGKINMIETQAAEATEATVDAAFRRASEEIEKMQEFQKKLVAEVGNAKWEYETKSLSEEEIALFDSEIAPGIHDRVFSGPGNSEIYAGKDAWLALYEEKFPEGNKSLAADYYEDHVNDLLHDEAIDNNLRADGRPMDEVRDIYTQAGGVSSTLHGSGTFYRGGTHVLSVLTLGGPGDSQLIEGMETQTQKHYMHHYNFPPFSVGEVGRMGMNRRMVGHGALAEKALLAVLPPKTEFPYTIRIVSESMASNGSTSMASVCGSTLALMDAGVPIKAPVAGIAMGLMLRTDAEYKILTDIQGPEDHHGDMDFKVAGTRDGITAIQMDIKVGGITLDILKEALDAAKEARLHIIDKIEEVLEQPRSDISPHAPKILSMTIKEDQIGLLIGPGGKTVTAIREETGAEIDIEDDGTVYVTGKNGAAEAAIAKIESLTHEYKEGEMFRGPVTKIFEFGALVKIGENTEGLVHISEIAPFRIANVEDALTIGEEVPVVVKEVNKRDNKIGLSIKAADAEFATKKGLKPEERKPGGSHGTKHTPKPRN